MSGDCAMSVGGGIVCTKTNGATLTSSATVAPGATGNIIVSNGSVWQSVAMSGGCTIVSSGAVTCLTSTTPPQGDNSTRIATTAFVANLPVGQASTGSVAMFISTSGTNSGNNCQNNLSPCKDPGWALRQCNFGTRCSVQFANGAFSLSDGLTSPGCPNANPDICAPAIDVFYYRVVSFVGDCSNLPSSLNNVTVAATVDNQTLFTAEDHSIMFVSCMTFVNVGSSCTIAGPHQCTGVTLVSGRQLAIVDADNLAISNAWPSGTFLNSTEQASVNCGGLLIFNSVAMQGIASLQLGAKMSFGCQVTFGASGSWGGGSGYAFNANDRSLLDMSAVTFTGTTPSGNQCLATHNSVINTYASALPGNANTCIARSGSQIN